MTASICGEPCSRELLPQVGRRVDPEVPPLVLDGGGSRRRMAPVAFAWEHWRQLHPTFGVPMASPVPSSVIFHVADQFRWRIASRFLTMLIPFSISVASMDCRLSMSAERISFLDHHAEIGTENPSVRAASF